MFRVLNTEKKWIKLGEKIIVKTPFIIVVIVIERVVVYYYVIVRTKRSVPPPARARKVVK